MNKRAKLIISGIIVTCMLSVIGCSYKESSQTAETDTNKVQLSAVTLDSIKMKSSNDDENDALYESNKASIILKNDSITIDGTGATVKGSKVTINESGTYDISGVLENGQIIVNAEDNDKVKLVLNGAAITCKDSSAIYIKNADKTRISLADGTENSLEDAETYAEANTENDEPSGVVFSKDDLLIEGNGALTVNGNYDAGIVSKNDLKIKSGILNITCKGDGIKGKDSVDIEDGTITINTEGEGIKATNDSEEGKGYVLIQKGNIDITSENDAIQAENSLMILDGNIKIKTGGGSENATKKTGDMRQSTSNTTTNQETSDSKKGLKSALNIEIDGGNIDIDSYDDGIHTDNTVSINAGTINIASGDDGIHGTSSVDVAGGKIDITESYEGIEGEIITIDDGEIHISSSDDGINASTGSSTDTSGDMQDKGQRPEQGDMQDKGQRPEQGDMQDKGQMPEQGDISFQGGAGGPGGGFDEATDAELNINGGYLYVNTDGDGLDSNGLITMTGGKVIVNGPTNDGNGALDYAGTFNMTGGFLVAAGSSGMLQAPDTSSEQYVISASLSESISGGTICNIKSNSGEDILTFAPAKEYQSVVVCSPNIKNGESYTISTGGTSTGQEKDGLYTDGKYSGGKEALTCTVSSIVTSAGTKTSRGQGGGMHGGGMQNSGTQKQ